MRTSRTIVISALALGLAALVACERKDDGGYGRTGSKQKSDLAWLSKAAEANHAEIDAGRLAQTKGESMDVKEFGQMMVVDHSRTHAALADLALKKKIDLPGRANEEQRKAGAELGKLSGAEFDRKFAEMMVTDHEKAVSLFESNIDAEDADVRAFVEKTLPVLKHHLQMARDLKSKVTGTPKAD